MGMRFDVAGDQNLAGQVQPDGRGRACEGNRAHIKNFASSNGDIAIQELPRIHIEHLRAFQNQLRLRNRMLSGWLFSTVV
jgi:hypothetical protein